MRPAGFSWVPLGRSCSTNIPLLARPCRISPLDMSFQVRLGGSFWEAMLLKFLTGTFQRLPAAYQVEAQSLCGSDLRLSIVYG